MKIEPMVLQDFCKEFGYEKDVEEQIESVWDMTLTEGVGKDITFLNMDFCRKYYPLTQGDPAVMDRLEEVCRIAAENPAVVLWAWLVHYNTFLRKPSCKYINLPLPEKILGENAGILQLICAMSCLPLIEVTHQKRNIPRTYFEQSAQWLKGTMQIYAAAHNGVPGFTLEQIPWMRFSVDGTLFRIGRLEYFLHPYPNWLPLIYRNRKDGSIKVLCRKDAQYKKADGTSLDPDMKEEDIFTAKLIQLDHKVTGTPIAPDGYALVNETVTLDLDEWECAASPWDLVPSLHIPGGGGMTPDSIKASLTDAYEFFKTYFQTEIKIFPCISWILNPLWKTEMPDSNMTKFMLEGFQAPVPGNGCGNHGLFFLFGRADGDPQTYPATTSMQKTVQRILREGKYLRCGIVFFCTDKLEHYGTQYYRNHC